MPEEPAWTEILDLMYQEMHTIDQPPGEVRMHLDPESDDIQYIAEETGRDTESVMNYLQAMESGAW